jgi:hypothetical protein
MRKKPPSNADLRTEWSGRATCPRGSRNATEGVPYQTLNQEITDLDCQNRLR